MSKLPSPWIAEYLAHLRHEGKRPATITTYASLLRNLDRALPEGLVYACADELREAIAARGKPATRALCRAAVRSFFAWACDPTDPRLDFDPSRYLPKQSVPRRTARPVPSDELADILARAEARYRLWFLLAAGNGLRCCEVSALDREHVTREAMWLHGKGGKERDVPTHPLVWAAIRGLPRGPVAQTPRSRRRLNRQEVQKLGNGHIRDLGHVGITMHRLRHWHGTHVHEAAGNDVLVVQELLGHASPNTTRVYVDTLASKKTAAVGRLVLPGVSAVGGDAGAAAA